MPHDILERIEERLKNIEQYIEFLEKEKIQDKDRIKKNDKRIKMLEGALKKVYKQNVELWRTNKQNQNSKTK